jgi:selenocysteine-specific elongation factor
MYVIGTAGHVDHGKSTLVEKLTGIDPDRLREEKERGMTIDLGFAWLRLPNGNEVSIVDVPGHERFVNNMLAGVGGIDLALLVVAADESVMPQTREHLAILDLLQVKRGLVAVTKRDLVDDDWLELVTADIEEMLEGTTLEDSPILAMSGTTGEGLPELVSAIQTRLDQTESRTDLGRPRLVIDRSFTISGFGTVVTGTLMDGSLTVGQEVEIVPNGTTTRIRGLQTHRQKLEQVAPGTRVAANLTGVAHDDIGRGEVLTTPGWLKPTTAMDVHLRVIPDAPRSIRHNMFATVHVGSSETVARVRLLEKQTARPGESTWAQFKLDVPIAAVRGDNFVIRSNRATLGGGSVVVPHARRHRRSYRPVLDRLAIMERGTDREVLIKSIEWSEPAEFQDLANRANLEVATVRSELKDMSDENLAVVLGKKAIGPGVMIFSASGWSALSDSADVFLEDYHRQFPLRQGAPKEELRGRLGLTQQVFGHVLPRLQEENVLVEEGPAVRRVGHVRRLSDEQNGEADRYLALLMSSPYSPPTDSPVDPEVLSLLADEGRVVRVSESVVFAAAAYQGMVEQIKGRIEELGEITVADVRDMFGASRKYSLALLDHMDKQRITRRVGDSRILR